jgi:hypothetical protein
MEESTLVEPGDPPATVWHDAVIDHSDGDRRGISTVENHDEILSRGRKLVDMVLDDSSGGARFRKTYYDISRTWHDAFDPNNPDASKLHFGDNICRKIEEVVSAHLEMRDAANVHMCAFWLLRRAIFALTSHDVDPDSGLHIESWHWTPNGLPNVQGTQPTVSSGALQLDPYAAP